MCCCCVLLKMSSTRRTSSLSSSLSTQQKTTKEFRVVAGGNITQTKTKKRSLSLSFSHHGRRRSRDGRYSQVRERSLLSFFCLLKSTHSKRDMMFQINNNMRFSSKIPAHASFSTSSCSLCHHRAKTTLRAARAKSPLLLRRGGLRKARGDEETKAFVLCKIPEFFDNVRNVVLSLHACVCLFSCVCAKQRVHASPLSYSFENKLTLKRAL